MAEGLEIVKTFAPVAAPLTAAIVETWVKPKLQKLYQYMKTDKALFENALTTKFDEYLQRAYAKNSFINVIVFQNQQKRLEEIYIPLNVKQVRGETKILISDFKEEFIPSFKKVLVKDTAGMGKSTLMKFLFLCCTSDNAGIPIFIELRKLKGDEPVLSYIYNELNPIDDEFDKDFILKLIKEGGFIFFLDGYDEIPFSDREGVSSNLQDFISKAGNNLFILTSRPESSLASFADFQEFYIQPLQRDEAFRLLRRYDNGGELSGEIISKIEGSDLQNIKEFLVSPLLVSLLYKSYEYKRTIPFKKHIFYRQVYDALFENHDLTKGGAFIREKYSGLDIEDFHRVLRALGFITVKLGQLEFEKDRWLTLITKAKARCPGVDFKESHFLKDLLTTVPLFNREGDYFRWAHKSIQEYFAAQFICIDTKSKQDVILRKMMEGGNSSKFFNVLDLCYDIDLKTFRRVIIYDILCRFLRYYELSYNAIDREAIREHDIHVRKIITFGSICGFFPADAPIRGNSSAVENLVSGAGIATEGYDLLMFGGTPPMFLYRAEEAEILSILESKGEDIFASGHLSTEVYDGMHDFLEEHITSHIDSGSVLVVDDDPTSLANQKGTFALVNTVFDDGDFINYLNYNKCRTLHNQIKREIEEEKTDDFFIDNL